MAYNTVGIPLGEREPPRSEDFILIVEDEFIVALETADLLANMGVAAQIASGVAKALQLLHSTKFCGAVLDVNLGNETSYPVADVLAARGIPFVFVTGYGRGVIDERYQSIPMFQKPLSADAVASIVSVVHSG